MQVFNKSMNKMKQIARSIGLLMTASLMMSAVLAPNSASAQPMTTVGGFEFDLTSVTKVEKGAGDRVGKKSLKLTSILEKKKRRTESYYSSTNLEITRFDWRGQQVVSEFYWLSMPISYQQTRANNYHLMFYVEPGLMTDLGTLSENYIGINFSAKVRKYLGRSTTNYWQAGLVSDRKFGNQDLRPLLAYAWRATPNTWIELGFPKTSIEHRFSKKVNSFIRARPEGGVWRYTVKGQKKDSTFNYRSVRVGAGMDFHWRAKAWLGFEIGQVRGASVSGVNNANADIKAYLENDKYWKVYADLRF